MCRVAAVSVVRAVVGPARHSCSVQPPCPPHHHQSRTWPRQSARPPAAAQPSSCQPGRKLTRINGCSPSGGYCSEISPCYRSCNASLACSIGCIQCCSAGHCRARPYSAAGMEEAAGTAEGFVGVHIGAGQHSEVTKTSATSSTSSEGRRINCNVGSLAGPD